MELGELIKKRLKEKRRTQRWMAEQIKVDEKTLSWKLANESITAKELIEISIILDIDLNEIKEDRVMKQWLVIVRHLKSDITETQFFITAENSDEADRIIKDYLSDADFDIPVDNENWIIEKKFVDDIPVLNLKGKYIEKSYGASVVSEE